MALQILNGPVIEQGESLSDGIDCTAGDIIRITMPAAWSGGNLTFLISSDGNGYNDLVDFKGNEVTLAVVPGSAVVVSPLTDYLKAVAYLKLRAGTREHPARQSERRQFAIAIEPDPARTQAHGRKAAS